MTSLMAPEIFTLGPGDVSIATRGDRLETLLGSCVAIILTDPRRTVAAMCHFVHTRAGANQGPSTTALAEVAWDDMTRRLLARGIAPHLCEAYAYGGGNMFPELQPCVNVGDDNVHWALHTLESCGIPVRDADLGGHVYRKIIWHVGPDTPRVTAVPIGALP